ncbi:MAG: molybdenum cofactor biosynthesis protein B [Myxococcales bacterium]|nr:molybdenum cofactor biosynthesis protein B [Myxococcales bacterium]
MGSTNDVSAVFVANLTSLPTQRPQGARTHPTEQGRRTLNTSDQSHRLDLSRAFQPLQIAVLTISDTRTLETDRSGAKLIELLERDGHTLHTRAILPDEQAAIEAQLRTWIAEPTIQVVLCTGGTGITRRDVTPEAFHAVYEKEIPGFGELFRYLSYAKIGTSTIQSRATAGLANQTLLFALPGSTGACSDAWEDILRWQLDIRHRPCNFTELLDRT